MNLSRILAILAIVTQVLTFASVMLEQVAPEYALIASAVAGAISAFTQRVHRNES